MIGATRLIALGVLSIAGCSAPASAPGGEPEKSLEIRDETLEIGHADVTASFGKGGVTLQKRVPSGRAVTVLPARVGRRGDSPDPRVAGWHQVGETIQARLGGGVTEWWRAVPRGLEQGFVVEQRPEGGGPLVITMPIEGAHARPGPRDGLVRLVDPGGAPLYSVSRVVAHDASGERLPAVFEGVDRALTIQVDDRGATYPLSIDPLYTQHAELLASSPSESGFGWSIAMSGDTLLVAAPWDDEAGLGAGAIYAFEEENEVWTLEQKILPPPTSSGELGFALAIDGDAAVVSGAQVDQVTPGKAFVLERSAGSWAFTQELLSPETFEGDYFGQAVAIDGARIVVGASGGDVGMPGAAFVFAKVGSTWVLQQKLSPETLELESFGHGVSIAGNAIAVWGGLGIRIFHETAGTWTLATVLADPSWPISMHSDALLAGVSSPTVFRRTGATWMLETQLMVTPPDVAHGWALDIHGDQAAVRCGPPGGNTLKSVCLFRKSGATWNHTETLVPSGGSVPGFAASIALAPTRVAVGRFSNQNGQSESVFVFDSLAAKGELCATDADCMSGHCSDGLCCDAACDGACVACDQLGQVGTCLPTPAASDPSGDCPGGACDGAGACSYGDGEPCSDGSSCQSGHCVAGLCCNEACEGGCGTCNGPARPGVCTARAAGHPGHPTCAPHVCDGASTECPTACSNGDGCADGFVCNRGVCTLGLDPAEPCTSEAECTTGYCADGVCCDQPCGGSAPDDCQACSVDAGGIADGACTQVLVTANVVCRAAAGPCDVAESCDGASTACPTDEQVTDGSPCDDGDECTLDDACVAGVCAGTSQGCPEPSVPLAPEPGLDGHSEPGLDGCSCALPGSSGAERRGAASALAALVAFALLSRRRPREGDRLTPRRAASPRPRPR